MKKQVIFNVGGALSSYLEFDNNKVIVDLGKNDDFNPVEDFLLPLAQKKFENSSLDNSRYYVDQVFLSHLDGDHISTIDEFDKYFHPRYLTAPCEHPRQNNIFNIIRSLIVKDTDYYAKKVLKLMKKRVPGHGTGSDEDNSKPLVVCHSCENNIKLYHIPGSICGNDESLKINCSNNTSLVLYIEINGHSIFMPGDIMIGGMEYLLKNNTELSTILKNYGVDFLVVPHHGLSTSFPEILFQTMKNKKTKRLNIISEKIRRDKSDEPRSLVDSRYYGDTHCMCNNNLDSQGGIKTSGGHIVIDYSGSIPLVKIIDTKNKEELIKEFL